MEYSLVIHVSNYECYSQDSRDTKRHQVEQWYHSQCRIVSQMSYRGFLLLKILFDLAWVPLLPSVMDFKAFPTVSTNSRSLLSYVSLWFCVPGCLRIVTAFPPMAQLLHLFCKQSTHWIFYDISGHYHNFTRRRLLKISALSTFSSLYLIFFNLLSFKMPEAMFFQVLFRTISLIIRTLRFLSSTIKHLSMYFS